MRERRRSLLPMAATAQHVIPTPAKLKKLGLLAFIPAVSPWAASPTHFQPIIDVLEKAYGGGKRVVFSAPRQHGKSSLFRYFFPWVHLQDPNLRVAYFTYSQSYTEVQSREIRRLYQACGFSFKRDYCTLKGWGFSGARGDFTASSVDGPANGLGANIAVIDDPFSGPAEAYNKKRRDEVYRWATEVVTPMLAPGASTFVVASRWDSDDLSGRLVKLQGYEEIRLEAINEGSDPNRPLGEPLCAWGPNPKEPRDLNFLLEIRDGRLRPDGTRIGGIGPHAWAALYQGKPLPPGGALFQGVRSWDLPLPPMVRVVIGLDLAYTTGAGSDYTAAVVLGEDAGGHLYVIEAVRMQQRIGSIETVLRGLQAKYPGARTVSYVSGAEKAIIEMLFHHGVQVEGMPARFAKLYRAQQTAHAWNQGNIFVPTSADWAETFLHELRYFSGVNDGHDDQVDALVASFDAMEASRPIAEFAGGTFTFGSPCM